MLKLLSWWEAPNNNWLPWPSSKLTLVSSGRGSPERNTSFSSSLNLLFRKTSCFCCSSSSSLSASVYKWSYIKTFCRLVSSFWSMSCLKEFCIIFFIFSVAESIVLCLLLLWLWKTLNLVTCLSLESNTNNSTFTDSSLQLFVRIRCFLF